MILRFEVNKIGNVLSGGALSVSRVAQARARRANRFVFTCKAVTVESSHFEMFEQQRGTVVFLKLPIVECGECC